MFYSYATNILATTLVVCKAIAQTQNCGTACNLYTLSFYDEFDGTSVDTTVWNFRSDIGNGQSCLSAQTANNVILKNGSANIILKQQNISGLNYTGGGLVSKQLFQYGYFETSMMVNKGNGWHSAFWMMPGSGNGPNDNGATNWTEIDVVEVDSKTPLSRRSNIFSWWAATPDKATELSSQPQVSTVDYSADFHTFGTLWNETTVTTFIDGVQFWTTAYNPTAWAHAFLNIWATTVATWAPIDNTALPTQSVFDYVRYYQKDYYLTASSLCGNWACPSNAGYSESGSWSQSGLDGYTVGLKSRYIWAANETATWTQKIPTAGHYEVAVWIVSPNNSDAKAVYSIKQNGKTIGTVPVDQTVGGTNRNPQNTGRWVTLIADIDIAEGNTVVVSLTSSGTGYTRSDTVKLVRIA